MTLERDAHSVRPPQREALDSNMKFTPLHTDLVPIRER